jgi:hypothetical protein
MDVEVKHEAENPAQANIAHLLKKFSGFYGAPKLHYHVGLPLIPILCQISILYNPIPFFFMHSESETDVTLSSYLAPTLIQMCGYSHFCYHACLGNSNWL